MGPSFRNWTEFTLGTAARPCQRADGTPPSVSWPDPDLLSAELVRDEPVARRRMVGVEGAPRNSRPMAGPISSRVSPGVCVCTVSPLRHPLGHSLTPVFLQVRNPGCSRCWAREGPVIPA